MPSVDIAHRVVLTAKERPWMQSRVEGLDQLGVKVNGEPCDEYGDDEGRARGGNS
jgi:hypothetical protein